MCRSRVDPSRVERKRGRGKGSEGQDKKRGGNERGMSLAASVWFVCGYTVEGQVSDVSCVFSLVRCGISSGPKDQDQARELFISPEQASVLHYGPHRSLHYL